MKVDFFFEGREKSFSDAREILIGDKGEFYEYYSKSKVADPQTWLSKRASDFFLAGTIGYDASWDFCDLNYLRPRNDKPDLIVGVFTKYSRPEKLNHESLGFELKRKKYPDSDSYKQGVQEAIERIFDGEIFEVNYTTQVAYEFLGKPDELFAAMRESNQGHWFSRLCFDSLEILSSSPECFLSVDEKGRVRTDPIKGTETLVNRKEIQSEKNRAENVMIVDLMRNDLTRFCKPGSVLVRDLFREEVVGKLVHLVSTVEGILHKEYQPIELLMGCFPAGSISGAPKLRAIEIAAELEKESRGFYCGTMFYSTPDGELKSSVLIRTATLVPDKSKLNNYNLTYGVGGAIVSDSDPGLEFEEALDKLKPISKFETDAI